MSGDNNASLPLSLSGCLILLFGFCGLQKQSFQRWSCSQRRHLPVWLWSLDELFSSFGFLFLLFFQRGLDLLLSLSLDWSRLRSVLCFALFPAILAWGFAFCCFMKVLVLSMVDALMSLLPSLVKASFHVSGMDLKKIHFISLQRPKSGIWQSILMRDSFIQDSSMEDALLSAWDHLLLALTLTSSEENCLREWQTIVRDAGLHEHNGCIFWTVACHQNMFCSGSFNTSCPCKQSRNKLHHWHADSSCGSIVHLSRERTVPRILSWTSLKCCIHFGFIPKLTIFICKQLKRPVAFGAVHVVIVDIAVPMQTRDDFIFPGENIPSLMSWDFQVGLFHASDAFSLVVAILSVTCLLTACHDEMQCPNLPTIGYA